MAMAIDKKIARSRRAKRISGSNGPSREAANGVKINGVNARPRLTSKQRRHVLGMKTADKTMRKNQRVEVLPTACLRIKGACSQRDASRSGPWLKSRYCSQAKKAANEPKMINSMSRKWRNVRCLHRHKIPAINAVTRATPL